MKTVIVLLASGLLWLPIHAQSNRNFKAFYLNGKSYFEKGNFRQAIVSYKEALRLEPKAQRYKIEGTFFANYLPRYQLALCFEKVDIIEADRWAKESVTASESSIIKRRDKARAKYNDDMERIGKAAKTHLAKLDANYHIQLQVAQNLLDQKKFGPAREAFQKLYTSNPNRPEATLGLGQVDAEKKNYLRQLELDFQEALIAKNYSDAEGKLVQLAKVDASHINLASLQTKLKDARTQALLQVNREPKETTAETVSIKVRERQTTVAENPRRETKPQIQPKPQEDTLERDRTSLRQALLATLRPYRRGDPNAALQQLEQIESPLLESSASYHWLKGLYLLTGHHYSEEQDKAQLKRAADAMALTAKLIKDFEPDPQLYPDFVCNFYQNQRQNQFQ